MTNHVDQKYKIRQWRNHFGISQASLGKQIGIRGATVCRHELGAIDVKDELIDRYVAAFTELGYSMTKAMLTEYPPVDNPPIQPNSPPRSPARPTTAHEEYSDPEEHRFIRMTLAAMVVSGKIAVTDIERELMRLKLIFRSVFPK